MENKDKKTVQKRGCENCKNAPNCTKIVGYIFGICSTSYEPVSNKAVD